MPAKPTKQFQNSEIPNYKNYNPIKGNNFNQSLVGLDLETIPHSLEELLCSCTNFQTIFSKNWLLKTFPILNLSYSYKSYKKNLYYSYNLYLSLYNLFQRRPYKFQPIIS